MTASGQLECYCQTRLQWNLACEEGAGSEEYDERWNGLERWHSPFDSVRYLLEAASTLLQLLRRTEFGYQSFGRKQWQWESGKSFARSYPCGGGFHNHYHFSQPESRL